MKILTKLDKWLLLLGFLIVLGLFTLAFVMAFKGGTCSLNPCAYALKNNISCCPLIGLP
jgi:hypothetical protein